MQNEENKIILIPKIENYIEYVIEMLFKIPRIEKFSIGNEYKLSMYKMLRNVLYLNKMNRNSNSKNVLELLNNIDAEINTQRIFLRILKKERWIDLRKFNIAMEKIYEIGKILGGLVKYYAKNNKKSI